MSTYLELVRDLCSELGLSGGTGPSTAQVDDLSILEQINACRWIASACTQLDNLWLDWKYHWNQYAQSADANASTIPMPTPTVRQWDKNKVRWRATGVSGAQWAPVNWYERQRFLAEFDPDNAIPGPPVAFTINPDNTFFFSAPFDVGYDFKAEYWQRPVALSADDDVPMMPLEQHRIIMCRAAIMYGNREDAPEIISGLEAEYIDILDKLQSDQLEGWELRRSSTDRGRHEPIVDLHTYFAV